MQIWKSQRAEEERLNSFINEITRKFERRLVGLQERHDSNLQNINAQLEQAKEQVAFSRSEFEGSIQKNLSLERELETQKGQSFLLSQEYERSKDSLGLVEIDGYL